MFYGPEIWFVLVNVLYKLGKNVYSAVVRWNILYKCQLYSTDWWCCSVQLWSFWFSAYCICMLLTPRTLGVGDGQGGLAWCNSWGRKESDMTERLNWTDVTDRGVLRSSTIITDSSIFLYRSINFCLMSFDAVIRCMHDKSFYVFLENLPH